MRTALEVLTALCAVADGMVDNRAANISDLSLRQLKDEVRHGSQQMSETDHLIDYEARCMVDCLAELSYARSEHDQRREERALMYINSFRTFLRMDLNRAARQAVS